MAPLLIVDDDATIRGMFARALERLGTIETAAGGAEALRLLAKTKYDVVLLDLHMPLVDGFVVLQTLAAKPGKNRDTPVYVITADNSDQARLRALKHRALFMLTKPVPIVTLVSLVSATLKRSLQPPGLSPLELHARAPLSSRAPTDDLEPKSEAQPNDPAKKPAPRGQP